MDRHAVNGVEACLNGQLRTLPVRAPTYIKLSIYAVYLQQQINRSALLHSLGDNKIVIGFTTVRHGMQI